MKNDTFIRRLKAIASLILILVKIWITLMPAEADDDVCPWRSPPTIERPLFAMEAQVTTLADSRNGGRGLWIIRSEPRFAGTDRLKVRKRGRIFKGRQFPSLCSLLQPNSGSQRRLVEDLRQKFPSENRTIAYLLLNS